MLGTEVRTFEKWRILFCLFVGSVTKRRTINLMKRIVKNTSLRVKCWNYKDTHEAREEGKSIGKVEIFT